jgi:hypothetical protein
MYFHIGPNIYTVRVCAGRLERDGTELAATSHDGEILLSGDVRSRERLDLLIDQLWRLHQRHYGLRYEPDAVSTFAVHMMRQLLGEGGEPALERMKPGRQRREAA